MIIGTINAQEGALKEAKKEIIGTVVSSDEGLKKGYVKMEITDVSSDDEQMAQMLEMMKGTETEVFFAEGQSLTVMNMMGGMVQVKNMLNAEGDMNMYMDAMGNKIHMQASKAELMKAKAEQPSGFDDLEFEYDMEDTKEIMGFKCYKMKSVDDEDSEMKFEAYITEEIKTNAAIIQGADLSKFKGFPLEYNIDMGQMSMIITCKDFKKEVDSAVFDIKADGYQK